MTPEQLKVLYKEVFTSDSGKKIMEDLGKRFSMNNSTYVPNSDETVYKEGQRSVLVLINNMMNNKQPEKE
jgi:hypothetical protein|tara:strand:+ start:82 stop:291 length:210 start_codon:yes stop_codon:yes gene_type:complete